MAPVLAGDDQRPVFLEGARVHELVDALADHPVAKGVAPGHHLRPVLVEGEGVPVEVFLQVGADEVRVDGRRGLHPVAGHLGLLDEDEGIALADHVPGRHRHRPDDPVTVRRDDVLHLHGLDDGHLLARTHGVSDGDVDGGEGALDGRSDPHRAVRPDGLRFRLGLRRRLRRLDLGVVPEEGQGIPGVDPGAREAASGLRRGAAGEVGVAAGDGGLPCGQGGDVLVQPARVHGPGGEVRVAEDVGQQADVGGDPLDPELGQGAQGPGDRRPGVGAVGAADHLGEQGIEGGAGPVAGIAEAVRAHPRPAGRLVGGQDAAGGAD